MTYSCQSQKHSWNKSETHDQIFWLPICERYRGFCWNVALFESKDDRPATRKKQISIDRIILVSRSQTDDISSDISWINLIKLFTPFGENSLKIPWCDGYNIPGSDGRLRWRLLFFGGVNHPHLQPESFHRFRTAPCPCDWIKIFPFDNNLPKGLSRYNEFFSRNNY